MSARETYPWHAAELKTLLIRRQNGTLPHALLFTGPAGLGKSFLAQYFAQLLLCMNPDEQQRPCRNCKSCLVYQGESHPDYRFITPSEKGNVIGIDAIRAVGEFLGLKSQFQGIKICIVTEADTMNRAAANSLLKTLEEPPPDSYLILVSARPAALPATIRSRCQVLNFSLPSQQSAFTWLAQQTQTDEADLRLALQLANGAPLKALAWIEQGFLEARIEMFRQLEAIVAGHSDPVAVAESWLKLSLNETLYWLYSWTTDMIRSSFEADVSGLQNQDLREGLCRIASRFQLPGLYRRLDLIAQACPMATTQVNKQLLLEELLISWAVE